MVKIGQSFVKSGVISPAALEEALKDQERQPARLGDILLRKGLISADRMAQIVAEHFQVPFVEIKKCANDIGQDVLGIVPEETARRLNILAFKIEEEHLWVAVADPLDFEVADTLRRKTGYKIRIAVAAAHDISEAIEQCYRNALQLQACIDNFINVSDSAATILDDHEEQTYEADDQPVVQYVKSLIVQAVNMRTSDVILQPKQADVELRFRIDGMLHKFDPPPKIMLSAVITRIKILSGLDIAERRLPQDGRFKVDIGHKTIDIRTSTFPTIYGESVVLRILDTSQPLLGLDLLGMEDDGCEKLKQLIHHSYGLILVTGPTGSGKTTTLYTCLNALKSLNKNIITLEDPVEYRLPFIQQAQVNPQIGFTFARGLRSILRQNPDIIMVGEIRDRETAEIAVHAALTGHLVFSTLHTNDAAGAVVRLINMGVEPFLISSSLLGVVAQRLVRVICPDCRESFSVDRHVLSKLDLETTEMTFYRGRGCANCLGSGYKGRKGIYEVLLPNQKIRQHMLDSKSSEEIRREAQKSGMKSLRQVSLEKLKSGITTPEEVLRVTQETEE